MTQPDTHDHPGGAAQPIVLELPDNAAELTSALYNVGDRFLTDDDEMQAIGMDLEEATLLPSLSGLVSLTSAEFVAQQQTIFSFPLSLYLSLRCFSLSLSSSLSLSFLALSPRFLSLLPLALFAFFFALLCMALLCFALHCFALSQCDPK